MEEGSRRVSNPTMSPWSTVWRVTTWASSTTGSEWMAGRGRRGRRCLRRHGSATTAKGNVRFGL